MQLTGSSIAQKIILFLISLLTICFGIFARGQTTAYRSSVDESLTIRTVAIAPMVDNVGGIYANPLTQTLQQTTQEDQQWAYRVWVDSKSTKPEELEDKPEQVKAILKKTGADSVLSGRISKGQKGISIKLNLFSGPEGYLLAQEVLTDYSGFETSDLKLQLRDMIGKLKNRMPYQGLILSRKNQMVTFNIGTASGLRVGDPISVIQVIKLHRHPKFHFLIGTEKEILGRIKVTKVDDAISFGTIEMEREPNILLAGMKLLPINFVKYPSAVPLTDGKTLPDLSSSKDSTIAFGEDPKEWQAQRAPTFGKLGILLGLGTYSISNTVATDGGIEDNKRFVPSIHLHGEMWLTTNWYLGLNLKQYVFSASNGLGSSTPSTLNISSLQTDLAVGYNFLMTDNFFGPKFQVSGGMTKFSSKISDSTPTAYTSLDFNGLVLGVGASIPIDEQQLYTAGAKFNYFLFPTVDESPVSSGGSATATMSGFTIFGDYRWSQDMRFRGEVMYDLFSASFSGAGTRTPAASDASHNIFTAAFGLDFFF